MSQRRVIKTLVSLGLSHTDAKVYICLATKGPLKVQNICQTLDLDEPLVSQCLIRLQTQGIVSSILEPLFSALPFHESLEILIKAQINKAQSLEQNRDEILFNWKTITEHS